MKTLALILAAVGLAGSAVQARAEIVDGIVSIVQDAVITLGDLDLLTDQTVERLQKQFRSQPETFSQKLSEMRRENLDTLMERQLILHEFKTAGYNLPESIIDDEVQGRIRSDYGDRATLMKTLQAEGITYEQYRERMREQVIVSVMKQKNVAAPVIVSPHKVEGYYQAHQDDFKLEDQVKLRMIVLTNAPDGGGPDTEKMAEEIRMKIKEGASFDDMAKVYSQGSERNHGGDWGWVERSVLRVELANAAFSLKPHELSEVVKIPNACCLVLVEDIRPAHYKPLSEVRKTIEQTLQFEERSRLEKEWIERLKKKTFVRIYP